MLLDNVLIIFIKYPDPGLVKTRLAKDIGNKEAALLYRSFVERILAQTNAPDFNRFIFYYPLDKKSEIINWLGSRLSLYPQKGDNLGERLLNAFKLLFKKGAKRVIVIGSDSPAIDNRILLKAFTELENNQCVVGPAFDGGYYLLGLNKILRSKTAEYFITRGIGCALIPGASSGVFTRRYKFYEDIFQDIDWSTDMVLKQTIDKLHRLKLKFILLEENFDIDTLEDLKHLTKDIY